MNPTFTVHQVLHYFSFILTANLRNSLLFSLPVAPPPTPLSVTLSLHPLTLPTVPSWILLRRWMYRFCRHRRQQGWRGGRPRGGKHAELISHNPANSWPSCFLCLLSLPLFLHFSLLWLLLKFIRILLFFFHFPKSRCVMLVTCRHCTWQWPCIAVLQ